MKKQFIICVACITVVAINARAQKVEDNNLKSTHKCLVPPPSPPAPPEPPTAPDLAQMPLPVAPPMPPVPLVPPLPADDDLLFPCTESFAEIINSNGYEVSIEKLKGSRFVVLNKDGKTQHIKLSTWNANRKFHEKKYGHLPPPLAVSKEEI